MNYFINLICVKVILAVTLKEKGHMITLGGGGFLVDAVGYHLPSLAAQLCMSSTCRNKGRIVDCVLRLLLEAIVKLKKVLHNKFNDGKYT